MFYEKNKKLFFCFIDFGSSFDLLTKDKKKRIQTYTPFYNPPEQNTPEESFESKNNLMKNSFFFFPINYLNNLIGDVFSLGVSFVVLKSIVKFNFGEEIIGLIEGMKNNDYRLRPSIDEILERLISYCDEKKYSNLIDIIPFLKEKKIFVQTPLNQNFSSLKTFFKIKEEKIDIFEKTNAPINLFSERLINGFVCIFVDSSKGRFDLKNNCYIVNENKYTLNYLGYPFFVEANNYLYLADIKSNSIIKYQK